MNDEEIEKITGLEKEKVAQIRGGAKPEEKKPEENKPEK